MTLTKSIMVASALAMVFATAPATFAQDGMMDKAKNAAIDKGKDVAKDKAADELSGMTGTAADKAIDVGADMAKGKSAKDAAMGAATGGVKSDAKGMIMGDTAGKSMTDTSMSTDEMMTAGKVMAKGGSVQDATVAVAKDRAKDKAKGMVMEEAGKMIHQGDHSTMSAPTPVQAPTPVAAPAAPAAVAVNCPSGTTAQPDGSCMITGDYNPG